MSSLPGNSPPHLDLRLLESSGFADPLPLPIRSVTDSIKLSGEDIKLNAGSTEKQDRIRRRTIQANDAVSSYWGLDNFELYIDNNFIAKNKKLRITNCYNFTIKTYGQVLQLDGSEHFFIKITHCQSFLIQNLKTMDGGNIITISDSFNFTLSHFKSQNASGYGLIIHNATRFTIEDCILEQNFAGIMVIGRTANGSITNCICRGLYGFVNCNAGSHLCATSPDVKLESIPDQCHEPLSIEKKTFRPQHIHITHCLLSTCRAQGLYLEGAVNCLIENNIIIDNNKEGVCFD